MHIQFNLCYQNLINILKFFLGSIWIYSLYPPNYVPEDLYCQKTTYRFAFGMTTTVWAIMGFMIILGYCLGFVHGCRSDDAIIPDHNQYRATEECAAGDV